MLSGRLFGPQMKDRILPAPRPEPCSGPGGPQIPMARRRWRRTMRLSLLTATSGLRNPCMSEVNPCRLLRTAPASAPRARSGCSTAATPRAGMHCTPPPCAQNQQRRLLRISVRKICADPFQLREVALRASLAEVLPRTPQKPGRAERILDPLHTAHGPLLRQ